MGEIPNFLADPSPIGREKDQRAILDLLQNDGFHVVTIHGKGGSGKTTLAKLVYDAVDGFDRKIRICVSDSFEFGKVIKKILDDLGEGVTGRENVGQLEAKLRDILRGERFLVVLEDLWSAIEEKWMTLANFLMQSSKQAKIIVTTREQSVVNTINTSTGIGTVSYYYLNVLSDNHLLSLLEKYAMRKEEQIPEDLRPIGEQIVARCEGRPLAVKILAVLLSESRNAVQWNSVRKGNYFELLLKLSGDLPVYCKDRFFYFSPLLQHEKFEWKDLFDLWMTDGLFESLDQEMSLTVVEKNLKSIIEEKHWTILRGLICHPTLIGWFTKNLWPVINASNDKVGEHVVHLSIGCSSFGEDTNPLSSLNGVQTLFLWLATGDFVSNLFSKKPVLKLKLLCFSKKKFKLLRMLVLKRSELELSSCRDYMSHLKCLNLSWNSYMTKLPRFIFKLQSLEILKLEGCRQLKKLSKDIKLLSGLKVLSITAKEMDDPRAIERLTSLQSLLLRDCKSSLPIGKYLTSLTALQSLTIYGCPKLDFTEVAVNKSLLELKLEDLLNLETLLLRTNRLQLLEIKHCKKLNKLPDCLPTMRLESIVIWDCPALRSLPEGMPQLQSLTDLEIRHCRFLESYIIDTMGDADQNNYFRVRLRIPEVKKKVFLCLENTENKVAVGLTHHQLGDFDSYVLSQKVGVDNALVLVQTCLVEDSLKFRKADVVGTFVISPKKLLVPVNAPMFDQKTKSCAQSGTSRGLHLENTQMPNKLKTLYELANKVGSNVIGMFKCPLSNELLGKEMVCIIDSNDIVQFATMQEISANCIAVYMKHLSEEYGNKKLQFLCPNRTAYLVKMSEKVSYCVERFKDVISNVSDSYILAPMNIGNHWVLILFFPKQNHAYYMDSLNNEPHQDVKRLFEDVWTLWKYPTTSNGKTKPTQNWINWRPIKCPKQDGSKECGYYVLKFMDSIFSRSNEMMTFGQGHFIEKNDSYSLEDLNEIRQKWVKYVEDKCTRIEAQDS